MLSDLRAIRAEARAEALDLDAIAESIADPRFIADDSITEYEARRRVIIRPAIATAAKALTPAQFKVFSALWKTGGDIRAAARICGRNEATVREHKTIIARVLSEAITAQAGDSIEAAAANVAVYMADIEAAEARALMNARRAAKAAEAAKAKAKAEAEAALKAAEARADLAEAIAEAIAGAVEAMPPAMRETTALLARGTAKREAARILGKNEKTIREAAKAAAARIAEAIAAAAPALEAEARKFAMITDLSALFALAARAA